MSAFTGFQTKILQVFLFVPMRATRSAHLILLKETEYSSPYLQKPLGRHGVTVLSPTLRLATIKRSYSLFFRFHMQWWYKINTKRINEIAEGWSVTVRPLNQHACRAGQSNPFVQPIFFFTCAVRPVISLTGCFVKVLLESLYTFHKSVSVTLSKSW